MTSRDQKWLDGLLGAIWQRFFPDIKKVNPVEIKWGRYARFRFGSIRLVQSRFGTRDKSVIIITRMFQSTKVPDKVVAYTVAHELAHYAHGFSSKHARASQYPHAGGMVDRDLKKRGLGHVVTAYKEWLKGYRTEVIAEKVSQRSRWWWM